ncbi:ankyrin repeat domain-containing protein 45 [Alligator mississippiensis]|uniref:ankyrin repeat domain-containing protein 45 n=1 Tax=Alligator mississippiensis TaxID=8496 RepID=UPI0028773A5B|nr:ankyrin repeat domain-containing protein 45 [Alligator mississippiensis]XP_019355715.2 ankyrin repeat domain-containing protein 45 [Alligator mississippiensis]
MDPEEAMGLADTGQEAEESEYFNPLLRPVLLGEVEGVQQIFENPEDPNHEKAMQLLLEKDVIGRDMLYAACMVGQSEVIRALAKYGVDMKDKTPRGYTLLHCTAAWGQLETLKILVELGADIVATTFRGEKARDIACRYGQAECVDFLDWSEAKQTLQMFISHVQATITDPEKVQGRLNKEDKNASLSACRAKSDWLNSTKEATRLDFLAQKQELEDKMLPIFTKMATPRLPTAKNVKSSVSSSRI